MSAAETRAIVSDMRRIARQEPLSWLHYGYETRVTLSRFYRRRRYMLEYVSPLHVGTLAMYDATRGELWIRPQSHQYNGYPTEFWERVASRTSYLESLMNAAPALNTFSETPETLAGWRNSAPVITDYEFTHNSNPADYRARRLLERDLGNA